jgi:hypothetical protein
MKKWYYNIETKEEKLFDKCPDENTWKSGRLPFLYWSYDKKRQYKEKRRAIVWSDEYKDGQRKHSRRVQKDRVGYTNGIVNIWLRIGQDIPDGFYKGWTIDDPSKYTRKGGE